MEAKKSLEESIAAKKALLDSAPFWEKFDRVAKVMATALLGGKKILIAGNGGSAADAQHFATEIVATLHREKRKGYPAMALTTDTSFLTAWVNDFGIDDMFARQVEAFGQAGDVFFGISTSGNSKNVIQAVMKAKEMGLQTVGLLGGDGGALKSVCDMALVAATPTTARIQESHIWMIHALCAEVVPQLVAQSS